MERLTHKARYEAGYKANKNVHDWQCVDKLGKLEDLEEQGKLLKLPCAVGDTVYCIMTSIKRTNPMIFSQKFDYSMIECFGISVFPTKEQAEEALKKMEDNNE